ncbi:MAG: hypothetical protein EOO16_09975 [Chitinophagaceae bacterium]|nr:MAG: hypothetical protein EOO16_09975 [Chitinophagaceae bacterium]
MLLATQTVNIGPGQIAEAAIAQGPKICLASPDWIRIQTYVENALSLPVTEAEFRKVLGDGAPSDLSDFKSLLTAYGNVKQHCTTWRDDTYKKSVSLASDIFAYSQMVPNYYGAINPLAQALVANPDDTTAKNELAALLDMLAQKAKGYHDNAAVVATKISTFANDTTTDRNVLAGTESSPGLLKYYNDKYGSTSTEVKTLTAELEEQRKVLKAANDEYDHDVIVAATTPTYAWVWPFGTIAAGVVAGIYGDKAVKALERSRAAQQQINSLSTKLAADAQLMIALHNTTGGITNILQHLNAALPIINQIQGTWGAIADDLNAVLATIQQNIREALPVIMRLGVQTAIDQWKAVGAEADAYRKNAYVTFQK